MSSAKSRNFRRRSGDDEEDDVKSAVTPSTTKLNGTPPTAVKPSTSGKPKKPSSQLSAKSSLLSFADDEDEDSPFSRPPPKPSTSSSASRFSKSSSAHKLSLSKDRITPHPPSSSLPSNVQPQAGLYTKEALLELQKNTKTLAAPARNKTKPEPEPVIVLKGSIKPVVSNEFDSGATGRGQTSSDDGLGFDQKDKDSSVESKMRDVRIGPGLSEDKEGIPDQATIEAIRAKRERLRQVRAAAPDYIALDGGSNHGEAEGLSDEEPEFQGRIGFFGDKIGGSDKKGVFEDFDERPVSKRGMEVVTDEEDEEDKMWEEEQVRKGLGKRLDEGVGTQGVGATVSGVSSTHQTSFGYPGSVSIGMHHASQNADGRGSYSSFGGDGFDMFGAKEISISQQAELARKAMTENLKKTQESHARTMMSLAKTEDNLSSSLLNVTSLDDALKAAGEKFLFMQKLREFVSVICAFLQHKAPFIEELEEQMQKLHEERAKAIVERRAADNDDEITEIELAISVARAELRKGSSADKVAAAVAASLASANAGAAKNAPVELDEFGRDVNLQKRMDITRRSEARKRRRANADSKRKLALEKDSSVQLMEGEFSTDESDSESSAHESTHNQLLLVAENIFSDAADEFAQFSMVVEKFDKWKKDYAGSYRDAYVSKSIPSVFSPYVRLELLKWDPLHEDADFLDMKWHQILFDYGLQEDENGNNGADADADANLIPELVEKLAIPILHHQLAFCWDILSTRETKYAVSAMNLVIGYVDLSSTALAELVTVLRDRLTNAVIDLVVPTWSPTELKAVPDAARVAAYRFGTAVRLLRNICLWNKILAVPVLEKIALNELLCGKILPHLHSIQTNVHEAMIRTERVVASLYDVWTGPSVTGDHSRKMQPLVDYLLLLGKILEKKHVVVSENETGRLVRRLKKMLVELNQYDHARQLSRTFNLKEAL